MNKMTPTRLFEFIEYQNEHGPLEKSFTTKYNGKWESLSTENFISQSRAISRALVGLGIKAGDKIAMISSNNRSEWSVIDVGLLTLGAVNIPIYPTISSKDYEYILNHSESIYCFVSDQEVYEKVKSIQKNVKSLKKVYSFDKIKGCPHWSELLDEGSKMDNDDTVTKMKNQVKSEDLATIIYTSGTTGVPKGVMLSHSNICNNLLSIDSTIKAAMELNPELKPADGIERFVSFLPISHSFERVGGHYSIFSQGTSIYYAEMNFTPEILFENIREVRPTFLTAVPRIFEKIHAKILDTVSSMTGVKKKLAEWSISVGLQTVPYRQRSQKLPFMLGFKYSIADKLVLNKFRAALGGKVRACSSGGSALSKEVGSFFCGIGISIIEGYGLTETSPVMTIGHPDLFKFGTVGKAIPGVEVKIQPDGEIVCRGHNVMMGYYKNEEATNEAIIDGWFHSGDIGEFDEDGLLRITDRKKSLIVTSGGKNVAPQPMEVSLTSNKYIEQCNIVGDDRNFISALIVPSKDNLLAWAEEQGLASLDYDALCAHDQTYEHYDAIVKTVMTNFSRYESVRKFVLIAEEWTVDKGELTPKMSIKRKVVIEKHKAEIDAMYNSKDLPKVATDDEGQLFG